MWTGLKRCVASEVSTALPGSPHPYARHRHFRGREWFAALAATIGVRSLASVVMGYIGLRLLEAYGLRNEKTGAEWLGALSGALYISLEIAHLMHQTSLVSAGVLLANILSVAAGY